MDGAAAAPAAANDEHIDMGKQHPACCRKKRLIMMCCEQREWLLLILLILTVAIIAAVLQFDDEVAAVGCPWTGRLHNRIGTEDSSRRWVILMRPGEEPTSQSQCPQDDSQLCGISHARSTPCVDGLSERGCERAYCLGEECSIADLSSNSTPEITNLFAFDKGERTIETLLPLANELNISIDTQFQKNDYTGLAHHVEKRLGEGSVAIVCWERDTIPHIAKAFGIQSSPLSSPPKWPGVSGGEFDAVWVIELTPSLPRVLVMQRQNC